MRRHSLLVGLLLSCLLCLSLPRVSLGHETRSAASIPNLLATSSSSASQQVVIPIRIVVGMLGLEGNGEQEVDVAPALLQHALSTSLPLHSPSSLAYQRLLSAQYAITYRVEHIAHTPVQQLEQLLSRCMRPSRLHEGEEGEEEDTEAAYEVQVEEVEQWVDDRLYSQGLAMTQHGGSHHEGDSHLAMQQYAVLIVSPSRQRMQPRRPAGSNSSAYRYSYRYGQSPPTQAWVSSSRFVFVDLSASTSPLTTTDREHGATQFSLIPAAERAAPLKQQTADSQAPAAGETADSYYDSRASPVMMARLCTLVIHAIETVFLQDVAFPSLPVSPLPSPSSADGSPQFSSPLLAAHSSAPSLSLIIPLIVLRNHRRFHPFRPGGEPSTVAPGAAGPVNDVAIAVDSVRAEVSRLLGPDVSVLIVPLLHELHDHHHLSASLFASMREDTVHRRMEGGWFEAISIPYLSSTALLHAIAGMQDELLASLPFIPAAGSHHRVFPVYIFSLLGLSPSLLLDRQHLYAASRQAALVLQTGNDQVEVPFFSDDGIVTVNARSVTRHVLAAIAVGTAGIVPAFIHVDKPLPASSPASSSSSSSTVMRTFTESFSSSRSSHSYVFSVGCGPFGPFSSSSSFSAIHVDQAQRNVVLIRLTSAMRAIQQTVQALQNFYDDYSDDADISDAPANGTLYAFLSALPLSPLPPSASPSPLREHLLQLTAPLSSLSSLRTDMTGLTALLSSSSVASLSTAASLSNSLLARARGYRRRVLKSVELMRQQLQCCEKQWEVASVSSAAAAAGLGAGEAGDEEGWSWGLLEWLLLLAVAAVLFYLLWLRLSEAAVRRTSGRAGGRDRGGRHRV